MTQTEFKTGVIRPIECLKEAWELTKSQYWLLFAITIVGMVIGGISFYILLGSMLCGVYLCYLQVIDGKTAEFDNLFKNIKGYFLPSLPIVILFIVPIFLVFGAVYVPFIYATIMGARISEDELFTIIITSIIVDFFIAIIMACFHTLLMFAFPLIVDRNLSGWQAIKLSCKSVWKNLGGVTGLWAVLFGINLLGMLACVIGVYLTIPLGLATQIVAYRKVFPKIDNEIFNNPPPPSAYNL